MLKFIFKPNEKIAFTVDEPASRALYVKNAGGRLEIMEKDGAIHRINGDGMRVKLASPDPGRDRETYKVRIIQKNTRLRLCVPETHFWSCVYLDVVENRFIISGGASIISKIIGERLEERLEIDITRYN